MKPRHFVLALAAVFLALAGGVVLGARVLTDPLVTGLRGDEGDLQQTVEALTDEAAVLNNRLAAADEFDTAMSARILGGALAGKSVVLLRTPESAEADLDSTIRLVQQAGGSVTGTIALTEEFVDGNAAEKLRSVVVSPIVPPGTQLSTTLTDASAQAGDLLGIALLIHRDPAIAPVDDAARDTVLAALRDTGFIEAPERIGAANTAVIITGGALPQDAGNQGAAVARFAAALAPHGSGTVLAGRDGAASAISAVAVTRADPGLAAAVTTVDDIGTEAGRITRVLALRALLDGAGAQKYGIGEGVAAVTDPQ
ncbi:MAG: copper transporter [Mycobacterium sp.]|nr:copper transporter [Mycobacterium sp.]